MSFKDWWNSPMDSDPDGVLYKIQKKRQEIDDAVRKALDEQSRQYETKYQESLVKLAWTPPGVTPIPVAIWPSHAWVSLEERRDFLDMLQYLGDDFYIVQVTDWDSDGSPHERYFK